MNVAVRQNLVISGRLGYGGWVDTSARGAWGSLRGRLSDRPQDEAVDDGRTQSDAEARPPPERGAILALGRLPSRPLLQPAASPSHALSIWKWKFSLNPQSNSIMQDSPSLADRFAGCLLGLALGDAFGARHEGGPIERLLWRLIGRTPEGKLRWTDDTRMSLDLAESLIATRHVDEDDIARRFAAGYSWSRGYGPGTARLLKRIEGGLDWREARTSVYPNGSFGNGAAMRAPVHGLFHVDAPESLRAAVDRTSAITHSHPLGLAGARLIAAATMAALDSASLFEVFDRAAALCGDESYTDRLELARDWLSEEHAAPPGEVAGSLGHRITALESTVTALYLALRHLDRPFSELLDFVARCRGDVDTIGAMAGAIWGAARGAPALPDDLVDRLEAAEEIRHTALALLDARPH